MSIFENLHNALWSLFANKLRSVLTMLGVIIGVAAIMTTTAIGEGAKEQVMTRIRQLGANVVTVFAGQQRRGPVMFGMGSVQTLKYDDSLVLGSRGEHVLAVAPELSQRAQVKCGSNNTNTSIVGTTPEYQRTSNVELEAGAFFRDIDVDYRRRVCVLGSSVADELFDERAQAVGQTIKIRGLNFHVLGVAKEKGSFGPMNPDDQVVIPVTTAMKRVFGQDYLSRISVEAVDSASTQAAEAEIETILRRQHRLTSEQPSDFTVRNQAEFVETLEQSGQTFTYMILSIAIVSLVVGGIGIMNIMLVSVTERTREIGLRKAVGAKRLHILAQFLIESMTLSLIGGLVGIGVGVAAARAVPSFLGWPAIISPMYTVSAFIVAAFVGVFFGAYPAWKAAKLHPIDALRTE